MKLTDTLKQAEQSAGKEQGSCLTEQAERMLTDDELEKVAAGRLPDPPLKPQTSTPIA